MTKVEVLRLGHRIRRDPRISTHCALVTRAFGADTIHYSGDHDSGLEESVRNIVGKWGGSFEIRHEKNWRKLIKNFPGKKVHLTMYGIPFGEKTGEIKKSGKVLVIIGGEKVPYEVYQMVDFNISVTGQPHSEVAALAVFLENVFRGSKPKRFKDAKIRIIPQERGKKTVEGK